VQEAIGSGQTRNQCRSCENREVTAKRAQHLKGLEALTIEERLANDERESADHCDCIPLKDDCGVMEDEVGNCDENNKEEIRRAVELEDHVTHTQHEECVHQRAQGNHISDETLMRNCRRQQVLAKCMQMSHKCWEVLHDMQQHVQQRDAVIKELAMKSKEHHNSRRTVQSL